jgi:peptidoglycan/xylan/chitin deacetylase (PgdA/CDA1 family)
MKKIVLNLLFLSIPVLAITTDVRHLKLRDSHLIFDDRMKTREVALTFAGEIDPLILNKILEILKKENLRAHFFITGDSAIENFELVGRLFAENHVVGSNGLSKAESSDDITNEIQVGHEGVYSALGVVYPFIRLNPRQSRISVRDMIKESGAFAFYWNIEFNSAKPAQSIKTNLKREKYRGIVSMPLDKPSTLTALTTLIDEIKKRDVTVITVLPNAESPWFDHPPLIRKAIQEEINKNGSIYKRSKLVPGGTRAI